MNNISLFTFWILITYQTFLNKGKIHVFKKESMKKLSMKMMMNTSKDSLISKIFRCIKTLSQIRIIQNQY